MGVFKRECLLVLEDGGKGIEGKMILAIHRTLDRREVKLPLCSSLMLGKTLKIASRARDSAVDQ